MSPVRPPLDLHSPHARIVAAYSGMQIVDGRDTIRVVLTTPPDSQVKWHLRRAAFSPLPGEANTFYRPHTVSAVFAAQLIGEDFFAPKETT